MAAELDIECWRSSGPYGAARRPRFTRLSIGAALASSTPRAHRRGGPHSGGLFCCVAACCTGAGGPAIIPAGGWLRAQGHGGPRGLHPNQWPPPSSGWTESPGCRRRWRSKTASTCCLARRMRPYAIDCDGGGCRGDHSPHVPSVRRRVPRRAGGGYASEVFRTLVKSMFS